MYPAKKLLCLSSLIGCLTFSAGAIAQESVADRYPAGSIRSVQLADQALAEAKRERAAVKARHDEERQACQSEFFMTSCLEAARERQSAALARIRKVEVEAGTFKRQERVNMRDQALERKRKRLAEQGMQPESGGNEVAPPTEVTAVDQPDGSRKVRAEIFPRQSTPRKKNKQPTQQELAAEEAKRAENIAAYERKVREAQARQKEVAERKARKEQRRLKQTGEGVAPADAASSAQPQQ